MLIPAIRAIEKGCPFYLSLSLLVTRVLADHENNAATADDLALFTHRLDRCSYFHGTRFAIERGSSRSQESDRRGLGQRDPGRSLSQRGHARPANASSVPASRPPQLRGELQRLEMPWREDPGSLLGDRDRVLEMSRQGAVLGVDRPVVVAHADPVPPGRD